MAFLNKIRSLLVVVLVGSVVALSGCSAGKSGGDSSASPSATASVSSNLGDIKVEGAFGAQPSVTVATTGWSVDQTRDQVLVTGQGHEVSEDAIVEVHYLGVNGRTGATFDNNFDSTTPAIFALEGVIDGFRKGLTGKHVGDRVLIAMTGADGYDAGGGSADAGIEVGDTLIFVIDINGSSYSGPVGETITPADGLPKVTEKNGKPVITIPTGQAPGASLQVQTLIKGPGRPLTLADTIAVHYRTVEWASGRQLENKYDALDSGLLSECIDGWKTGLVGQTVGSRVLLVVPNAYPNGANNPPVEAGQTLVYVIDILYALDTSSLN